MLEQIIRDPKALWDREPPASREAVAQLARTLPTLPAEYLAFLALSNGGEGDLALEPGWFQLWRTEEVVALNDSYEVATFLPGFIGLGSSGGGELLAFGPEE